MNLKGVWVGCSNSVTYNGESFPAGSGIALTRDGGATWQTLTPIQADKVGMISYDLSVYDTIAYSACFYGGLIRTLDYGATWQNLFATQLDSINADSVDYAQATYLNFSNRYFSVTTDTTGFPNVLSVWGGNANGIHRFFFYADTLTHAFHTYPDSIAHYSFVADDTTLADTLKLPGNHVVGLAINKQGSQKTIWAACRPVSTGELRRVAYSSDDGVTWHAVPIEGPGGDASVEGWAFAFAGDTVYAATSFGLYKSNGDYSAWTLQSNFKDIVS